VDIRNFDNLWIMPSEAFLQLRVRDGVLLRLIGKWLEGGCVSEDGRACYPTWLALVAVLRHLAFRTFSCTMCWTHMV
jgi:hypothetical protein